MAYYCFVDHGRAPSEYDALPYRDKIAIAEFAKKHARDRARLEEELRRR